MPTMTDPTLADRIALAVCQAQDAGPPCPAPCVRCRAMAAAAAHEIADYFSERYEGASTTADTLYAVGCHQPDTEQSVQDGWKALERKQDPRMWPAAITQGQEAAALAVGRELRRPDV